LDRVRDVRVERRSFHDDDPLTRWAAGMPKPAPAPVPSPTLTDAETLRWQKWIDDRIVAAVVGYHEAEQMRPVTRAVLKGLVAEMRAEILTEVGLLRADITIQKAAEHGGSGDVVELPPFIQRRRHDVA
jgi:hypothetical protein